LAATTWQAGFEDGGEGRIEVEGEAGLQKKK
jgi:hypothetical protein